MAKDEERSIADFKNFPQSMSYSSSKTLPQTANNYYASAKKMGVGLYEQDNLGNTFSNRNYTPYARTDSKLSNSLNPYSNTSAFQSMDNEMNNKNECNTSNSYMRENYLGRENEELKRNYNELKKNFHDTISLLYILYLWKN